MLDFSVKIISDRVSDRSKGFGFVTFASEDEAQNACKEMNGKVMSHHSFDFGISFIIFFKLILSTGVQVLNGRVIYVDTAKPSTSRYTNDMPIARGPPEPKLSPDLGGQD